MPLSQNFVLVISLGFLLRKSSWCLVCVLIDDGGAASCNSLFGHVKALASLRHWRLIAAPWMLDTTVYSVILQGGHVVLRARISRGLRVGKFVPYVGFKCAAVIASLRSGGVYFC